MPIDWAVVNWLYIALMAVFAFISSFIGILLSFNSKFLGALIAAVVFAIIILFWTYYPHNLPLPVAKPV